MSNIEKINDFFHLPISFDKKSMELNPTIITDLELKETIDPSGTPLYHFAFQPKGFSSHNKQQHQARTRKSVACTAANENQSMEMAAFVRQV